MKALLDKYLKSNYSEASKYAAYFISRSKLPLNPNTVISNAYLRYCKIDPQVKEIHEAKAYFFHIIKTEILWRDTDSRLEFVTASNDEMVVIDEIDLDLDNKIEIELRMQNQQNAIEVYRQNITDRVKLIFFETYYDKGINTTRTIADHFNISSFSAHLMITEMKNEIKDIFEVLKHE